MTLDEEAARIEHLLGDKVVTAIHRPRKNEIVVEFTDGSRLFAYSQTDLEISVT